MSNADNPNYLDAGYNNLLQTTDKMAFTLGDNVPLYNNQQFANSNGNVETMPVKSDGSMGDVWISTFIKSTNWQPKTVGFYIDGKTGYAEFSNVYIGGNIVVTTGYIGGWTININSITGTGVVLSSSGDAYLAFGTTPPTSPTAGTGIFINKTGLFGLIANVQKFKIDATTGTITATGAVMDGTSTLGGRIASTIATAIDSSGHFADNAISTASGTILGSFTFGASGALQIGTYVNGVTGDIRISPTGILGRDKNNATTFSINATTGVAVLNGLVVGTNVGQGTAVTSGGVTTIIGNTVTTGFINALNITVLGTVSAGTLVGLATHCIGNTGASTAIDFYSSLTDYNNGLVGGGVYVFNAGGSDRFTVLFGDSLGLVLSGNGTQISLQNTQIQITGATSFLTKLKLPVGSNLY